MAVTASTMVSKQKGVIDRRMFVDKDIYDQELEQIFGRCWLFLGHDSQIPKPNDFIANYMGEDPILLVRDAKGKPHAFLNMCRHRGNRICRADYGNAPSFMCTYHGWTFATDGKLVGVPGYKEAYFEELDRSQWGLVEAQVDSYKGLLFGTWDKQAPTLIDYMGDMAWYLDLVVDRREGGVELSVGLHRWVIDCNWKFGADNFGGDGYHVPVTHGSIGQAGITRSRPNAIYEPNRWTINPGNGHAVLGGYDGPGRNPQFEFGQPVMRDYYAKHLDELEKRLGSVRAKQASINVANMFPNFTWHPGPMLRLWHPHGPLKTEVWSYCVYDKDTPPDVKEYMRRNLIITFGPGGAMEADDMNNWLQCTNSGRMWAGRKVPMNVQLRLGQEKHIETLPGVVAPSPSETNQRAFYSRWAEIMDASSWSKVPMDPKTR